MLGQLIGRDHNSAMEPMLQRQNIPNFSVRHLKLKVFEFKPLTETLVYSLEELLPVKADSAGLDQPYNLIDPNEKAASLVQASKLHQWFFFMDFLFICDSEHAWHK